MEDLIPDEDVVVTITKGGYAKRTKTDLYRVQRRGGKGVRGAALRGDDMVEHMFMATSPPLDPVLHHRRPGLPRQGLPAARGRRATPRAATSPGCCRFQPDEEIAQVLAIRDYEQAPYLVLATRKGLVKKTRLGDYNSPRQAGVIAINFRDDDDELIGAELVTPDDDLLLISRKGQAIRFRADDDQLRPMGRATSGVTGMKFRGGDSHAVDVGDPADGAEVAVVAGAGSEVDEEVAARSAGRHPLYVFTITDGGFAKRTRDRRVPPAGPWRSRHQGDEAGRRPGQPGRRLHRGRGRRGAGHQAVRSGHPQRGRRAPAPTGRDTKGVKFVGVSEGDAVAVGGPQHRGPRWTASNDDVGPGNATIEEGAAGGTAATGASPPPT